MARLSTAGAWGAARAHLSSPGTGCAGAALESWAWLAFKPGSMQLLPLCTQAGVSHLGSHSMLAESAQAGASPLPPLGLLLPTWRTCLRCH